MKCDKLKAETIVPQGCTLTLQMYPKGEVDAAIAELKDENRKLKRALWLARSKAAKFWANYWFNVGPWEYVKYDRIGRMEDLKKEFILTKVTKHMTSSDWIGLWEKVEQLCLAKAEEYK